MSDDPTDDAGPEDGVDEVGRVVSAHLDAVPDQEPKPQADGDARERFDQGTLRSDGRVGERGETGTHTGRG